MTTGYLMLDQPNPYTAQGTYPRRGNRGKLTGTCILHTTEGAWTAGVQSLINLVRSRSDYGCYHVAVDWQDIARLYPWEWETWQDSETNNWAVGISAACRTSDWAIMPADIREGYYRNMARAAADFIQYVKTEHGITVPLARLSGEQARAGMPGFCAHGDSGLHRSDPGADFDWTTFFNYTRQALGSPAIAPQSTTPKEPFTMGQYEDLNAKLDDIGKKVHNTWAGVWDGGSHKGKTYGYGILPIVVESQRRDAENAAIIKNLISALAATAKGEPLDQAKLLAGVQAAAEAGVKAGITDGTVTVDVNVNQ
jgi:tetrahydromethanopterin S-methyltransferase subunit G